MPQWPRLEGRFAGPAGPLATLEGRLAQALVEPVEHGHRGGRRVHPRRQLELGGTRWLIWGVDSGQPAEIAPRARA